MQRGREIERERERRYEVVLGSEIRGIGGSCDAEADVRADGPAYLARHCRVHHTRAHVSIREHTEHT